jgi:hypothetical protein
MPSTLAPIAFFAFNRPEHTRRALESLAANPLAAQSELFIFCDGPRREDDYAAVDQVRQVAAASRWCGKVNVLSSDKNRGCAESIIYGVTKLCADYGRVIVIEDDLVLSPFFLDFMNSALVRYEHDEQVFEVSGYMFPVSLLGDNEAGFLPFISSWGWATWRRAWQHFDPEMTAYHLLAADPALRRRFDLYGSYPYFAMLEAQRQGLLDSWAIRWYLTVFFFDGLALFPRHSLVSNHGFDGSGTHCGTSNEFCTTLATSRIHQLPSVALDISMQQVVFGYLKSLNSPSQSRWIGRLRELWQSVTALPSRTK